MTAPDRILRRLSSALAKHPGSTNAQIAAIAAHQFDVLGCTYRDILDAHQIEQSVGASLNRIVALLDLVRNPNESDEQLRNRFYVELSRRQVSGTRADILAAIATISDWEYGIDFLLLEPPNIPAPSNDHGAFCIDFLLERDDLDLETQSALGTILQASKPAGVLPIIRHHRTLPAAAIAAGMFRSAMLDLTPSPETFPDIAIAMNDSVATLDATTDETVGFESITGWTFAYVDTSGGDAIFSSVASADGTHTVAGSSAARIYNKSEHDAFSNGGSGYGRLYKSIDMTNWGFLQASFYMARVDTATYWIAPNSATFIVLIDGVSVYSKGLAAFGSYCYEDEWFSAEIDVRAYSGTHSLEFRFASSSTYDRYNGEALWIDGVLATVPA